MKSIFNQIFVLLLAVLLIPSILAGQPYSPSITISVDLSYPADYIGVSHSEEYKLEANFREMPIEDRKLEFVLPSHQRQLVMLSWFETMEMDKKNYRRIFLSPGDEVVLSIQKNEAGKFMPVFEGSNAPGHEQFYKFQKFVPAVYIQDMVQIPYSDTANYADELIKFIESHTRPFVDLLNGNSIDSSYYSMVTNYIHSIFCGPIVSGFFRSRERIGTGIELNERYQIADKIIQHFNFGDPNSDGVKFSRFADNRITLLRYIFLRDHHLSSYTEINGFTEVWEGKSYEIASKYVPIFEEEDEFLRKYLMAATLHFEFNSLFGPEFEGVRGELYSYFKANYPNSRYLNDLETARQNNYEKYLEFTSFTGYEADKNHRFYEKWKPRIIDTEGKMKGFDYQLKKEVKPGVSEDINLAEGIYYVTLWATWCGPCLKSFSKNYETDSLLDSFGVNRLYISSDNPQSRFAAWQQVIKDYKLGGYHVLAGQELTSLLLEKFGTGGTILIPRYFIISEGEVVIKSAPAPGSLYELEKILTDVTVGKF
ncbi:MAG: hypothetical protein EA411_09640 [Saprospirales bacterium]|nr:MAG: hypothetical protein EA411_09640 [Saprospirales bacterium]